MKAMIIVIGVINKAIEQHPLSVVYTESQMNSVLKRMGVGWI